jgi:hypothetical protein
MTEGAPMRVYEATVKGLEGIGVEAAFAAALASGRPSLIDARITRCAIPHYSPSPQGVIDGLVEMVEQRFHSE